MNKLKKTILGTSIILTATLAGMTGDYYLNDNITIAGDKYTKYEYSQLKTAIIDKVKERKEKGAPTYEEYKIWVGVADIELRNCTPTVFKNIDNENIVDEINNYIETCK